MEVQGTSSQTTVTWTGTTTFSKTVSETLSAIASSDCLTVTGTTSKKSKTTIAARSITITPVPSSGSCTAVGTQRSSGATPPSFPGGGGQFRTGGAGGGSGTTRGSFPGGGGQGRTFLANLTLASGKVTAVSGSSISLTGIVLSGLGQGTSSTSKSSKSKTSSKSKAKKPATPKTQKLKITTSKSTTLSETQAVTSSALAVGVCVNALGPMATNGAVTASTVRITSPVGGSCTAGAGGFPGGGGFFGPGGGGGGPTGSNG
jgi:hypothetical protein